MLIQTVLNVEVTSKLAQNVSKMLFFTLTEHVIFVLFKIVLNALKIPKLNVSNVLMDMVIMLDLIVDLVKMPIA